MDGIMPQVSPVRHQYSLNASTKAGSQVVFSGEDGFPFPSGGLVQIYTPSLKNYCW